MLELRMHPNDLAVLAMRASISCSKVCKVVHHLDFSTPEVDGCHCFVVLTTTPIAILFVFCIFTVNTHLDASETNALVVS